MKRQFFIMNDTDSYLCHACTRLYIAVALILCSHSLPRISFALCHKAVVCRLLPFVLPFFSIIPQDSKPMSYMPV